MQEANLRLSGTDQRKEIDKNDYCKRAHLPDSIKHTLPPPVGRTCAHLFYHSNGSILEAKETNCIFISEHHQKKQLSSRNPFSKTHCQLQKEVSLNLLKT